MNLPNIIFHLCFDLGLLILTIIEIYKGVLMIFKKQEKWLLAAQLSFFIFRFFPIKKVKKEEILKRAKFYYKKRLKLYGFSSLIGGIPFALMLSSEIISQINQIEMIN